MTKKAAFAILLLSVFAALLPVLPHTAAAAGTSATTYAATNVTATSATISGSSTFQPTQAWFDFGPTPSMDYSIAASNGVGQATGLQPGTTYYYRYVAKNADGITCFGDTMSFTTPSAPACTAPVASTDAATNVTGTSATINGSATGNTTRTWFDFGTDQTVPYSIADSGGSGQASGLQPGKTYYYRYVAQNNCGTSRGTIMSFTTPSVQTTCPAPAATTGAATNVTQTSATISGSGNAGGSSATVSRTWFDFGTDQTVPYSIADNGGTGQANGLQPNTTYYYRYVVQNNCGNTTRGTIMSFTTPPSAPVCTAPVASTGSVVGAAAQTSAQVTGSVTGSATVWVEYGTDTNNLNLTSASQTTGGGAVSFNLTGLTPGTTYFFRIVAQNSCGTSRGQINTFNTPPNPTTNPTCTDPRATNYGGSLPCQYPNPPQVCTDPHATNYGGALPCQYPPQVCTTQAEQPSATTMSASGVTQSTAVLNGSVGTNSASSWFEYGTTPSLGQTINASGGTASIGGLQPNTVYYYRMVAQNNCGTARGTILTFQTQGNVCTPPSATTGAATNVVQTSATLNGTTANATAVWFAYGTDPNNLNLTSQTTVGPNASVTITGLQPGTVYYFRIVAQSSCGTANGQVLTLQTQGNVCTAPTAAAYQATGVGQNSATLNGYISTSNSATYYFAYGTDPNSLNQATATQTVNASSQVSATISNLQSSTTYYYRLVVQNSCGTQNSQVLTLTTGAVNQCTAPTATASAASGVTQNSALLTGYVNNPSGGAISYYFAYGTSGSSLNQFTPTYTLSGNSQTVTATVYNLQPNTNYYYALVVQSNCGTNQSQVMSFFTTGNTNTCQPPSVNVYSASAVGQNSATLNGYVNPNGTATTYWFQYGVNNSFGYTSPTQGPVYSSQSVAATLYSLNPNTTYYFTLVAQNSCGTSYGQTTLNFYTSGSQQSQSQGPLAITNPATSIANTSALLNGQINPNNAQTNAWFEWGTTTNLGFTTSQQSVGSGSGMTSISFPLTGLTSGRTYYFRAVAQNQNGTSYGSTLSFTTGGGAVVTNYNPPVYGYRPPVIVTTVSGGGLAGTSCLVLTPAIQPSNPIPGGDFTYSITYRNDCPFDLRNVSLRNYLPNEVDFSATSYPFVSRDLNVITYNLGIVPRGFQNTVMVKGLVHPNVQPGDSLIYKSDLTFFDPQNRLQSVSAFLTATVAAVVSASGMVGTASVLDTLYGFLSSGWFWFLLFLLLLALFILWLATRNRHAVELEHE